MKKLLSINVHEVDGDVTSDWHWSLFFGQMCVGYIDKRGWFCKCLLPVYGDRELQLPITMEVSTGIQKGKEWIWEKAQKWINDTSHDIAPLLDECRQALEGARDYYPEGLAKQSVNTLLDKIGGVV